MLAVDFFSNGLDLKKWVRGGQWGLGATPNTVVEEWGGMRLLKYEPPTLRSVEAPLVIIPSLINRSYILDLLPEKSLIEYYRSRGVQLYMIDWGAPADEDKFLDFDHLVADRVTEFLQAVRDTEGERLHLLGHCLGGTIATIYASLWPQNIASLTLLTTPVDFANAGKLGTWAAHPSFDLEAMVDAFDHAPWALMQGTFQALKPFTGLHKLKKLAFKLNDPEFVRNFFALEVWSADNISFIGPCWKTLIQRFYRENQIVRGNLKIKSQSVKLENVKCPIFNLVVDDDHIVLPSCALKASYLNKNADYRELHVTGGHIGALLGNRAQKNLWPELASFLEKNDQGLHALA